MAETTYSPGARALYSPKYNPPTTLIYPETLGSAERTHMVIFKIFEIAPSIGASSVASTEAQALKTAGQEITRYAIETTSTDPGTIETSKQARKNTYGYNWNAPTKENPSDTIGLYMPDTLNFVQNAQYDNLSIADAISNFSGLGQIAKGAYQTVTGSTLTRGVLANAGVVFNPQEQLLFEGIDFRTFDMSFTLTPRTQTEAQKIVDIIKKFRYHAAPQINSGTAGFFFTPPSVFELTFMSNGTENTNMPKLKRCVLESVDVNYAPNGWAAHANDGMPVQTSLQMRFKEILLVDKNEIDKGF